MGVSESVETAYQVILALAVGQGAFGDGRDHGERVLDAVAELGREHLLPLLRSGDAGDIDQRHDHAVNDIITVTIRVNSGQIIALSLDQAHRPLDHLTTAEHLAQVVVQLRVDDAADDITERSSAVAGNQIEQLGYRRRERSDREISVEKNRRDLCTLKQIGKIAVGLVELLDFDTELVIDGLQFLVDRLQLFL